MSELVRNIHLLERCTEDILSVIKPTEDDRTKRLAAIREIVNTICLVPALRDAAVKPFGSFVSMLYTKSGDLDVSVELPNDSGYPTGHKRKKKILKELKGALEYRGLARDLHFIPNARVPVLQYVSNHFGISCDISIDNYCGQIKSRALYWISTLDDRFGDMVLLVKEWAKAQNINNPKKGTLSSYTLCMLVLVHFQVCKPAILPPLKEIFYASIAEGSGGVFNEKHFDQVWEENIAKFRRQDTWQRNQSSLSDLLATFSEENSTYYTGQLNQTKGMAESSCKIVNDPFDRSDKTAMFKVEVWAIRRIAKAFERAKYIVHSSEPGDRNELLWLLCTPEVGSKLGGRDTAGPYTDPAMSPRQHTHTGSTGSGPIRRPHGYNSGRQSAAPY